MKLRNQEILNLRAAFNFLCTVDPATNRPHIDVGQKLNHAIARNIKRLTPELEALDDALKQVREKRALHYKDELAKKQNVEDEFTEAWQQTLEETTEVNIYTVTNAVFEAVPTLPANVTLWLLPLVAEEEKK